MKILFISYVWPEPKSSAAGLRDIQLLEVFERAGWQTVMVSASKENEFSYEVKKQGHEIQVVEANDSRFDEFLKNLSPDLVVFDRYITEEQFGWRVKTVCPDAIRVVESQDVHFLRKLRGLALEAQVDQSQINSADLNYNHDLVSRELASFLRSDLTLILSDFEIEFLQDKFQIPSERLFLHRFSYQKTKTARVSFQDKKNFCFIGNYRHPPNEDGFFWFKDEIWPELRKKIPQAEVHFYGAYIPKKISQSVDHKNGIYIQGWSADQYKTLSRYRVNLAPLRFGAGIKGKISDAWSVGTPTVSTPIGAEGMCGELGWPGRLCHNRDEFIEECAILYENKQYWQKCVDQADVLFQRYFCFEKNADELIEKLINLKNNLNEIRSRNYLGQMLWYHQFRSTEFFSRWIESKNQVKGLTSESSHSKSEVSKSRG